MPENLFKNVGDLVGDFEESPVQEIESLCMDCEKMGVTRMLLTMIPYFKEVVVMSFKCDHCGNINSEIQSAGEIQQRGSLHTVHVTSPEDLDRQIVKSEHATVSFLEYELTVPEGRGQLTNIEGVIRDTIRDLSMNQPLRKVLDVEVYNKINHLLSRLRGAVGASDDEYNPEIVDGPTSSIEDKNRADESHDALPFTAFTVQVRDPSGNSFVSFKESPNDPKWSIRAFKRTHEENVALRLANEEDKPQENVKQVAGLSDSDEITADEVLQFPGICSSCAKDSPTNMKKVNIPYFQDILIMSTNCEHCGFKDNEVKSGGAIPEKGKRITLKVEDEEDLSRDILKSEHAGLSIPDINLVLEPGTLGGRFTTLEGLLAQVYEDLSTKAFIGDSAIDTQAGDSGLIGSTQMQEFDKFLTQLKTVMTAAKPFTVIIDDPLSSSYIQNFNAPEPDEQILIEEYERTYQQNDDLGLTQESGDFTLPSLGESNTSFVNSLKLNNVTDMKRHGRLSKWSATNKARFLKDLDAGKAGDWIVALGNQAADTDSLASSIAMAYHLEHTQEGTNAIALLQTPRDSLDLRPENKLALRDAAMSHGDHQDLLTIDELPMKVKRLAPLLKGIALVDHPEPVGDWKLANISAIIDHHKDRHWGEDADPRIIEMSKSCSSLVARDLMNDHRNLQMEGEKMPRELADILLAAIALDSDGLENATDVDLSSAVELYKYANGQHKKFKSKKFFKYMTKLNRAYRNARKDLEQLNFLDLLKRDYKGDLFQPSNHKQHRLHLGFASIPFSIEDQIKRSLPSKTLREYRAIERQFMIDRSSDINVIMSKHKEKDVNGEKVKVRDIGVLVRHDGRLNGTSLAQVSFDNIVKAIEGNLQVKRWNGSDGGDDGGELGGRRRIWTQIGGNGADSGGVGRKVIRPLIEESLRSIWGKTGIDLNGSESGSAGDTTSERGSSSPGMRSRSISISRPPSAYSAYSARTARSAASAPLATAQNTEKELPKPYEANEGSEISTIIEDNEDTETINGERANGSESTFRAEDARANEAQDQDSHSDSSSSSNSLRRSASFKSLAQSVASTTDQSFVSAQESIESMSSAASFHSTPSTLNIQGDDENDASSVSLASQYSQSSANNDEREALDAATALPDVQVDNRRQSADSANNVDANKESKPNNSTDTSPANTVVDSIFDSTQRSHGSPTSELESNISTTTAATVTPKQSPTLPLSPKKRNFSTTSNASTVRASMTRNLPDAPAVPVTTALSVAPTAPTAPATSATPPKGNRRRVASTPSNNNQVNFRRLSTDTSSTKPPLPERPQSQLLLPSDFVKMRKSGGSPSTVGDSVVSESTKYPASNATSTTNKIPRSEATSATTRSRTWSVSGTALSSKPSVKRPTTSIDQMLPDDALGIDRSMLSISVTSGAAEKLTKPSKSFMGKKRSANWSGARGRKHTQLYKPTITLGLNSHFKPPQKLDPHSVLIKVHSTALDNFDAMTLMRGSNAQYNNKNKSGMEAPPGPEYGFIPGRMALGQVVEVGWKVKNINRQWVWALLSTEKSGCLSEYIVVNRTRVSPAPIQKAGQDISKLSTVPLKAFAAQKLSTSHMTQLKQGSRILVLAASSNPYNSVSTYIIEELKERNCQVFVQTTTHSDFNYGVGVYELAGTLKDITSDQLEGSFEMVIDARLCFDEKENIQALEWCRRILCRNGAFITLVPDMMDVDQSKPVKTRSLWSQIVGMLFGSQSRKSLQKVVLGVPGEDDVDPASGMDVRDILDEIARKINSGVYSTFLNDNSHINAYQLENATSAFHTIGFNERGNHINNQPLSDYAVVRMRS
ncbi:hypothetical protein E3P84_03421 [Wallemia ichthyophaga]|nr:hypothetical protein E3P84_03421 [Wallemia ichthyophaga]TIB39766.1 hypothetical protein E3P83_03321 [Wallemia ichthyophaga]